MKMSKKLLSIIMAILVMVGSMGIVSSLVGANTDQGGTTAPVNPEYMLKFDESMGKNFLTCDEMSNYLDEIKRDENGNQFASGVRVSNPLYEQEGTNDGASVVYNSDGSITLSKAVGQRGANLEIKVTDEMKENFKKATDNKFYISFYFEESKNSQTSGGNAGKDAETQFAVFVKYKNTYIEEVKDDKGNVTGTKTKQIKLSSLNKNGYYRYQQNINKTIKFYDTDGSALQNLDNVESFIFSVYSYTGTGATAQISGITYQGSPAYKEFVAPAPQSSEKEVALSPWSKYYDKGYGDPFQTSKYQKTDMTEADFMADRHNDKNYSSVNGRGEGWAYYKDTRECTSRQYATAYEIDRAAYNDFVATANQDGGSKKGQIKVYISELLDTENKEMMAEFQLQFVAYSGAAITPIQKWIDPGKEHVLTFDASEFDFNMIRSVRVAFMAFWYYDEANNLYYDVDTAEYLSADGEKYVRVYKVDDEGKKTDEIDHYTIEGKEDSVKVAPADIKTTAVKITAKASNGENVDVTQAVRTGKFTRRTINKIQAYVSPVTSVSTKPVDDTVTTTASQETTTEATDAEYEHAGYHFYDWTLPTHARYFTNHPSYVNFYDKEKDEYTKTYLGTKWQGGYEEGYPKVVKGSDEIIKDFAKDSEGLPSGGYQVQIASPYPRIQQQHQVAFWATSEFEDADLKKESSDHGKLEGDKDGYNFMEQMRKGLEYAKNHTDPEKRGYLAIDVFVADNTHGYKNTYNKTYAAWCKKNGKKVESEKSRVQLAVNINAGDYSVEIMQYVYYNEKTTLYLDVSELEVDEIYSLRLSPMNYENMANVQQGGDNSLCGITDLDIRFSALYIPGKANSSLTTTIQVTEALSQKDAQKIKKLYDALPGLTVDDYETEEDYEKLLAFIKAWNESSIATQEYCQKEYGIDYITISMLEWDVYEKFYGADGIFNNYGTGDIAFPMLALLVAGISGYVLIRTRKRRAK